jgi:hypothetical protein
VAEEHPQRRVVVPDDRGNGHLQVTWHAECDQFVVSQWRGDTCVASTRLTRAHAAEVVAMVHAVLEGQNSPGLRPSPSVVDDARVAAVDRPPARLGGRVVDGAGADQVGPRT